MIWGPGTYKDEYKFGDSARNSTISGIRKEIPISEVPGPGFYNP